MYHDDRDVRVYISGDGGARGGGRAAPYAREAGGGGGSRVTGNRVFITNLSYNTTWQDLKDHARQAGEVVHAKVLEADGRSRGMGVVEYASRSDAAAAIRALDGSELDGRVLGCREDREFEERAGGGGGFGGGGGGRDRDRDRDDRLPDRAPPPRLGAGGGGGADTCYTCGGVGHRSRDCPSEPGVLASRGGGSGFGGGSRGAPAAASADGCRLCGEVGHYARECPNGGRGGGGRGGGGGASDGGGCRICGVVGHFARECPTAGGSRGGGGGRGGGRGGDRRQIDPAKLDADMDDYFKSREGK